MEKPWLKYYPENTPPTISTGESILEEFDLSVKKYAHRMAFENYGQKISFQQWDNKSTHFASYLKNHCGFKKGDRVAVQIPNTLQFPIVVIGILKAGLTAVNINPLCTARETKEILKDSEAKALLIFSHSAYLLKEILEEVSIPHIIVTHIGDLFSPIKRVLFYISIRYIKKLIRPYTIPHISLRTALKIGTQTPFKREKIHKEDLAFLQYTGGTTGSPKGAMLTHLNIVSNFQQCRLWLQSYLDNTGEVSITALPLYHIFALMTNILTVPLLGVSSVLITNPKDMNFFIQTLQKTKKWSIFIGVNALFKLLLDHPEFKKLNFQSLKLCIAGGTFVEEGVYNHWMKTTSQPIIEGYGLTEASPVVCCNLKEKPILGMCGLPLPSTNIQIRNTEGRPLPHGQAGELAVQGPQVMKGYWKNPEETQKVLDSEGWLMTGDIAQMTQKGWIQILDRKKDLILVSGFNVYPNEVESIIAMHPQVKNCAVVGVFDEHSGEAPKAFIVKKNGAALNKQDIIKFCKDRLAAYKIPKRIEFKEHLPHSHVGKILRKYLKKNDKTCIRPGSRVRL